MTTPSLTKGAASTRKPKSKRKRRITVEDTFTGETTYLYSLRALVSFCGNPKLTGRGILSHYRTKLFKRRYRFTLDTVKEPPVITRAIEYYDYVNKLRMIFANLDDLHRITGYAVATAEAQLACEQLVLWNGVAMKYVDDLRQFPRYDDEDIRESLENKTA